MTKDKVRELLIRAAAGLPDDNLNFAKFTIEDNYVVKTKYTREASIYVRKPSKMVNVLIDTLNDLPDVDFSYIKIELDYSGINVTYYRHCYKADEDDEDDEELDSDEDKED